MKNAACIGILLAAPLAFPVTSRAADHGAHKTVVLSTSFLGGGDHDECVVHNGGTTQVEVLIQILDSTGAVDATSQENIAPGASAVLIAPPPTRHIAAVCHFGVDREDASSIQAAIVVRDAAGNALAALPAFASVDNPGRDFHGSDSVTIASAPLAPIDGQFMECVVHNAGTIDARVQFQPLDINGTIVGNSGLTIAPNASLGISLTASAAPVVCTFIVQRRNLPDLRADVWLIDANSKVLGALPVFASLPDE